MFAMNRVRFKTLKRQSNQNLPSILLVLYGQPRHLDHPLTVGRTVKVLRRKYKVSVTGHLWSGDDLEDRLRREEDVVDALISSLGRVSRSRLDKVETQGLPMQIPRAVISQGFSFLKATEHALRTSLSEAEEEEGSPQIVIITRSDLWIPFPSRMLTALPGNETAIQTSFHHDRGDDNILIIRKSELRAIAGVDLHAIMKESEPQVGESLRSSVISKSGVKIHSRIIPYLIVRHGQSLTSLVSKLVFWMIIRVLRNAVGTQIVDGLLSPLLTLRRLGLLAGSQRLDR